MREFAITVYIVPMEDIGHSTGVKVPVMIEIVTAEHILRDHGHVLAVDVMVGNITVRYVLM
jgi:hypothetical protein